MTQHVKSPIPHLSDQDFWQAADQLVGSCEVVVDRPLGSRHPRLRHIVYPLAYGYLRGTTAMDGGGIDVWVGSMGGRRVSAAVCTIDLAKKDAEVKLLIDCTPAEIETVYGFHNEHHSMKGCLLVRNVRPPAACALGINQPLPNE